jgi:hypothetical protein
MSPAPTIFGTLKLRRDNSARWAEVNPVLAEGEPAVELDTGKIKIGDGETAWNDLGFLRSAEMIEHINSTNPHPFYDPEAPTTTELLNHIDSEEPHPVYDDGPSLTLLYENVKV